MIREVQLEEGLVEEYEKRFKDIYEQCKVRQAEVREVELRFVLTSWCYGIPLFGRVASLSLSE